MSEKDQPHLPPLRLAWFMWGLGALFYLMAFFHRVAPAVMTQELMRDFQITGAGLGNLSAFYFYSYVFMQIPTGVIADIWGPRRLLSAGALVAGIGTILFALAPGIYLAGLGRFLIGGSVAVAFVGMLKLANNWFPLHYFAMITGMALLFGITGAVFAGPPLRILMNYFDWRILMLVAALVILGISFSIWTFVRDWPHQKGYADRISPGPAHSRTSVRQVLKGVGEVFSYRNTVLLFIVPAGMVGSVLTFSGLWGVPYLTTHQNIPTTQASALTSSLLVAFAAGGPIFGWFSDALGRRKPLYIIGCCLSLICWAVLLYVPSLPFNILIFVLLLTGFSSGSMVVSFAFAKESVPIHLSGTVAGVINMGVMLGPMLLQPAVGFVLDLKWGGATAQGVRTYGLHAYQAGFSLMVSWLILSFLLLLFTRETRCRQQV